MANAPPTSGKSFPYIRPYLPWLLAVLLACLAFNYWLTKDEDDDEVVIEEPSSPSFIGTSDKLASTLIVPTLNAAIPPNHSAIWAATSNLAWKELHQLAGGDVVIDGQPDLSKDLNSGIRLNPSIEKDHYFAAAGLKSQGIYNRVQKELAARFPSMQIPPPTDSPFDGILAFACFKIVMKYQFAFLNDEEAMTFRDSKGNKTKVKSFGIRKSDSRYGRMRDQIGTFFHDGKGHYAIDLSTGMTPYQVILASVDRGSSLQATIENFDKCCLTIKQKLSFGSDSILSVPNMEWAITHHYGQLIGKIAHGPKLPDAIKFEESVQQIDFRMDRTGVTVSSSMRDAAGILNGDEVHRTGHYIFDQPFLIIVRKRNVSDPIFVMWVDNAELLKRW